MRLAVVALLAGVVGLVATAWGGGSGPTRVVSGLHSPVHLGAPAGEQGRLYVVEQAGVIRVVESGRVRPQPFLDIRRLVQSGGEQGLFSVAFHPRYATSHRFYVDYTDLNGDTRVVEYRSNGTRAIPSTARQLFFERQPYPNHNGGQLAFGPDGLLYIGMGDGGSGGDPENNGQTLKSKLAKLWRLDVDRAGARPELVGYGLRNPWRFSFDRATGDLYIGDVGQNAWEEIDYVARGDTGLKNFGWAVYEGRAGYGRSRSLLPGGALVWPITVYGHGQGCSVTGGFVYRGKRKPELQGRYVYGDYCSGTIWSLRVVDGEATGVRREPYRVRGLTSFGEDAAGGLYALAESGTVYRIAG